MCISLLRHLTTPAMHPFMLQAPFEVKSNRQIFFEAKNIQKRYNHPIYDILGMAIKHLERLYMQINNGMEVLQKDSKAIKIQDILMRCRVHIIESYSCMVQMSSHGLQVNNTHNCNEVGDAIAIENLQENIAQNIVCASQYVDCKLK